MTEKRTLPQSGGSYADGELIKDSQTQPPKLGEQYAHARAEELKRSNQQPAESTESAEQTDVEVPQDE